jgi:hypothetical protein
VNSEILAQLVDVEVLARELELQNSLHIDRFFAFLLEFELHVVLLHTFDRLARQFVSGFFQISDVHRVGITKQANDVGASDENNTFALLLEDVCIGRERGDVEGRVVLLCLNEVDLLLAVLQK